MHVSNSLEEVVPKVVEQLVADEEHLCGCEDCASDVLALTLSKLRPGYSSTEMGRILKLHEANSPSGRARITVAGLEAIAVVKNNPRHSARHQH
jgi:hypothetical protein